MTTSVDVLAVMDAYVTHWSKEVVLTSRNPEINDAARCELAISTQVRAAVAELIEAIQQERLVGHREYGALAEARERTNAALARVKGA